eukprot:TRINITY_DN179_c0_g1_i8.p3 TRINITY_DN179_c0_g1~~TRINITY_DN179_c0_g1_i8.p3  ORF type:complete len:151 (+),score=20.72 TRINITY_DN179_c0_g1_i8:435-887(+)
MSCSAPPAATRLGSTPWHAGVFFRTFEHSRTRNWRQQGTPRAQVEGHRVIAITVAEGVRRFVAPKKACHLLEVISATGRQAVSLVRDSDGVEFVQGDDVTLITSGDPRRPRCQHFPRRLCNKNVSSRLMPPSVFFFGSGTMLVVLCTAET